MSVKVLKCISAEKHPNADKLRLYKFCESDEIPPEGDLIQVVANMTNIYNVGDFVYVALEGAVLTDGTVIKPTKLRGIESFGMALGLVPPLHDLGEDVTNLYCYKYNIVPSGASGCVSSDGGGSILITASNDAGAPNGRGGAVTITAFGPTGPIGAFGDLTYESVSNATGLSGAVGPKEVFYDIPITRVSIKQQVIQYISIEDSNTKYSKKIISSLGLVNDVLTICFDDNSIIHITDGGQDCCESRYMSTDDDLPYYIGSYFKSVSIRSAPDVDDNGDCHEVQFLVVNTSNGEFVMANHNVHNGYYGGFAIIITEGKSSDE